MSADYQKTCDAILEIVRREERLKSSVDSSPHTCFDASLKWMLDAGILLRTRPMNPSIDPKLIGEQMGKPVFSIQPWTTERTFS